LPGELANLRLALMSAGGVFRVDDDPMGPDGPTQQEALTMIKDFLRGAPTLSVIPKDTPDSAITARHPGYDARTAQRDPGTVFPLGVLRALEAEGALRLAADHYAFTGATSQVRLREQVAPEWAQRLRTDGVDACLLVAT
jgi:glycine/betaine/sarcosine/D-proline reductase family selenoprotein B